MSPYFILFLIVCITVIDADPKDDAWKEFKQKHEKKYKDDNEEKARFEIFKATLDEIEAHNQKHKEGKVKWRKTITKFSDLTDEEFLAKYTGFRPENNTATKRDIRSDIQLSTRALPSYVDWRKQGAVSAVLDQGDCNSCWAFTGAAAIEGLNYIKKGTMMALSKQQLCACVYSGYTCDQLGSYQAVFRYVQNKGGLNAAGLFTYDLSSDGFGPCSYDPTVAGVFGVVTGYTNLPTGDETALQNAIANIGPIAVAVDATDFKNYESGTIFDGTCTKVNHAVLAVGYDSNNDGDYYIVKNSYGPDWGENGYVRMPRNTKSNCFIADNASYPK